MQGGQCPKCGSHRIATTRFAQYLGAGVSGPTFRLYACADCRYTEQYLDEPVERRVAVLDAWEWLQPDAGPFR
jgi:predicted nucleic-acid-binding Zn-ribbon protein